MSITIELPVDREQILFEQAARSGESAADYARHLLESLLPTAMIEDEGERETLDMALAGVIGIVNSGGAEHLSEDCGDKFTAKKPLMLDAALADLLRAADELAQEATSPESRGPVSPFGELVVKKHIKDGFSFGISTAHPAIWEK